MAVGSYGDEDFNEMLRKRIANDFIDNVDPLPFNDLNYHREQVLTKDEEDRLKTTRENRGRREANRFLLDVFSQKKDWFSNLLKILRNDHVKLNHLADKFQEDKDKLTAELGQH